MKRNCLLGFIFVFLIALFVTAFSFKQGSSYLSFSDGAKFADIARNMAIKKVYGQSFRFWSPGVFDLVAENVFPVSYIPPLMPYSIALVYRLLGINDFAVVATSFLYFILLLVFSFLLTSRIFKSNLVGMLSILAIGFNQNFIDYATSGASEVSLMFEIVASVYFVSVKKSWATSIVFILAVLMYFTRPQAFIFIAGILIYWLILNFEIWRSLKIIIYFLLIVLIVDIVIFRLIQGRSLFYPLYIRGLQAANFYTAGETTSDALRGGVIVPLGLTGVFKKVFYHLYNFYKALPSIASPYMWGFFIIGLFHWGKNRVENSLKMATIFMVALTFLVTALTIPFFRYLHPVIPLVYLFATATLVWIVKTMVDDQWLMVKKYLSKFITKERFIILNSLFLILFFVVGQTLGVIFLDSRFKAKTVNKEKPPVYVQLSWKLKEVTNPEDIIITNLDTWGSWYGERKTVWFPLEPVMLVPPEGKTNPFDAIYLTSYLVDDENYYMGEGWRQIFTNPENPENKFIKDNFKLKGIYEIPAHETYEKQDARAVLLVKKVD